MPSSGALHFACSLSTGRGELVGLSLAVRESHVGLALGDGRFVFASAALGEVRADHLGGSYWRLHYLGARRILASQGGWDERGARHRPKRVVRGKTGPSLRRLRP